MLWNSEVTTLRRRNQGFTIPEVLIGAGLLAVITLVLVQFLVPALRTQASGQVQAELLRAGMLSVQKLTRDVRLCPASALTYSESEQMLAGGARDDWTAEGTALPSTQRWAWRYEVSSTRLSRLQWAVPPSTPLERLTTTALHSLTQQPGWKIVASRVVGFHFHARSSEPLEGPFEVYLDLELNGIHLQLSDKVQPRLQR